MAQLGARFHGMEEVVGSIPTRSTNHINNLARAMVSRAALGFHAEVDVLLQHPTKLNLLLK